MLWQQMRGSPFAAGSDWVLATGRGTRSGTATSSAGALGRTARIAGLDDGDWPPLRFHDLRHTFASHPIVDLGLDVVQVSGMLGHARVAITLDVYAHLFEEARHAAEIRQRMAVSPFARLLTEPQAGAGTVVELRAGAR
jgi:integrase